MTNGNRVIRDARKLAERLEDEGRFRMAEIVRALCRTYEQSRRTNRLLYTENAELREQAGDERRAA